MQWTAKVICRERDRSLSLAESQVPLVNARITNSTAAVI